MRARRWLMVLALTIAIYATLPWAPLAWRWLRGATVGSIDALAVALLAGAGILGLAVALRRERLSARLLLGFAALVAGYAVALGSFELTAAEKLHFVFYGVLAWFVYDALRIDAARPQALLLTVPVVAIIGLGDELIQHVLPNRHFEWKDVTLNAVSGALAVAAIAWWGRR